MDSRRPGSIYLLCIIPIHVTNLYFTKKTHQTQSETLDVSDTGTPLSWPALFACFRMWNTFPFTAWLLLLVVVVLSSSASHVTAQSTTTCTINNALKTFVSGNGELGMAITGRPMLSPGDYQFGVLLSSVPGCGAKYPAWR